MTIAKILNQKSGDIVTVSPDSTLQDAAQVLTGAKVGALVCIDSGGALVGILSERDIVRVCAQQGPEALAQSVSNAMTTQVMTAVPSDSIDSALARMTDRRIRHLPVLQGGALVGVVSIGDLVKAKIDETLADADAMRAYIAAG
jgi:CBS domain-containing protein